MKLNLDDITDDQQQRMCDLCERNIICGSSNSFHYQCEGRHCEDALEYLKEDIEDQIEGEREEQFEQYKYLLIK